MGFFGLFKKTTQVTEAKNDKTVYECFGINENEEKHISLNEKQELLDNIKERNKVFNREEINTISSHAKYDVWNAFKWHQFSPELKSSTTIKVKYKFSGVDKEKSLLANPDVDMNEFEKEMADNFSNDKYFNKVEIQDVSMKLGYDVWEFCKWDKYSESRIVYEDGFEMVNYEKSNSKK